MKRAWISGLLWCLPVLLAAQQSPSFKVEQGTFNGGGNPSPTLSSTHYQVTLDAIGDGVAQAGLASPSYGMDAGLPPAYRPPGEVLNLRFSGPTTLTWNAEASVGSYNLYRGDLSVLPGSYGTRVLAGLNAATTTDIQTPDPGQCLFYLVTATNRLGEEGTKGTDSAGKPRP